MFDPSELHKMSLAELAILKWHLKRREAQTCPDPQPYIWFLLGGRGSGKTLTAASHIFETACNLPDTPDNKIVRIALVGQTYDDVKKTMVEGHSGLQNVIPKDLQIKWNKTIGELYIKIDGPIERELQFSSYTAQVPAKLRGPNFHLAWIDEPAKFEDADIDPNTADTTWSNLMFATRIGKPHIVVSGTPTPCKLVRYFLEHKGCVTKTMTTWDNRDNLPEEALRQFDDLDHNSRAYKQEVLGMVLLDNPNSMFDQDVINDTRADPPQDEESQNNFFKVLGYDPSISTAEDGDEAGIILVGYTPERRRKSGGIAEKNNFGKTHAYILEDLSGHYSSHQQSEIVIRTILDQKVDDLILEQNQGADLIVTQLSQTLSDMCLGDFNIRKHKKPMRTDFGSVKRFTVTATRPGEQPHRFTISAIHASTNKRTRAETASIRYSTKRVHHPPQGALPVCKNSACGTSLENQMTSWNPDSGSHRNSPDRMDALVYCLLHVFGPSSLTKRAKTTVHTPVSVPLTKEQVTRKRTIASIYSEDMIGGRGGFSFEYGEMLFSEHPQLPDRRL